MYTDNKNIQRKDYEKEGGNGRDTSPHVLGHKPTSNLGGTRRNFFYGQFIALSAILGSLTPSSEVAGTCHYQKQDSGLRWSTSMAIPIFICL